MNTAGFALQSPLGALAQMGERLICIQEVSGSIPLGSTILWAFDICSEFGKGR